MVRQKITCRNYNKSFTESNDKGVNLGAVVIFVSPDVTSRRVCSHNLRKIGEFYRRDAINDGCLTVEIVYLISKRFALMKDRKNS